MLCRAIIPHSAIQPCKTETDFTRSPVGRHLSTHYARDPGTAAAGAAAAAGTAAYACTPSRRAGMSTRRRSAARSFTLRYVPIAVSRLATCSSCALPSMPASFPATRSLHHTTHVNRASENTDWCWHNPAATAHPFIKWNVAGCDPAAVKPSRNTRKRLLCSAFDNVAAAAAISCDCACELASGALHCVCHVTSCSAPI